MTNRTGCRHVGLFLVCVFLLCKLVAPLRALEPAPAAPIKLLLNDPVGASPSTKSDSPIGAALLHLIERASSTIDFAVYGMRNQSEILVVLQTAKNRGVRVRGVVDRESDGDNYYSSTDEWVKRLSDIRDDLRSERRLDAKFGDSFNDLKSSCRQPPGFEGPLQCLRYDLGESWLVAAHASREKFENPNRIMHNKFFVVDGRWTWTGSANISDTGTGGYNANAAVIIDSPQVASIFPDEFLTVYSGKFHSEKGTNGVERLTVEDAELMTWFSPQDHPMRWGVEPLIAKATKSIDIAVFFLTSKFVTADLIAAKRLGVRIRVIIDATAATNGYTKHELLRTAGISVKV